MDLVLVSDNPTLTHEVESLLREAVGVEPIVLSGESLLAGTPLPPVDVVLIDQKTWHAQYAMFRFFNLLHYFDRYTLVSVARGGAPQELKGRSNRKDLTLMLPTSADVARRIIDDARELSEQRFSERG